MRYENDFANLHYDGIMHAGAKTSQNVKLDPSKSMYWYSHTPALF